MLDTLWLSGGRDPEGLAANVVGREIADGAALDGSDDDMCS
jgi:hypothetical protein